MFTELPVGSTLRGGGRPLNLLGSRLGRRVLFAALYLTEGAPMGFIWWALPTLLARQGVTVADITLLTSTVTLPWVFKFLAGPLVDASLSRGATLKRWILTCQTAMVMALLPLAWLDWQTSFQWLLIALLLHACFAATQDVAIDTLAIRSVPLEELGGINGWMQAGMLAGRAAIAAGTLGLANSLGAWAPIVLLALVIGLPMILLVRYVEEPPAEPGPWPSAREWVAPFLSRVAFLGLVLALAGGAGFEFLSVVVGPLMVRLGVADRVISGFFGILAPSGLISGALLAGWFSDRFDATRATGMAIIGVGVLVSGLAAILPDGATASPTPYVGYLAIIWVAIGFFTAASYALFMQLSQGALSATRFAVFMAMTNACEAWAGFAGGRMTAPLGYPTALFVLVGASAAGLGALLWLARLRTSSAGA